MKNNLNCLAFSGAALLYIPKDEPDNLYKSVSRWDIISAEFKLGLRFAPEFKSLLLNLGGTKDGCLCFKGLLAGSCYDVVAVTSFARTQFPKFPPDMYVVDYGLVGDGGDCSFKEVYYVQNKKGEVFSFTADGGMEKASDNFTSFLEKLYSGVTKVYGTGAGYFLTRMDKVPVEICYKKIKR